ncbi:MAG: HEAT repeat domain-containing protein [Proteobacteria bacterium]|nr:HEAT repeat domain-containing protein [Pseudomonadota bacterium]
MNKTKNLIAAVAVLLAVQVPFSSSAFAGKGGSSKLLSQAIASGSTDAIIAEVEKTEGLMCETCVQMVTDLTEDARYPVREVAGWWFAKRPALAEMLADQFKSELDNGNSIHVRNAADFLGSTRTYTALPNLRVAITRTGLDVEARLAIVRAAGSLAHVDGNAVLVAGMKDRDASVRTFAVKAWRDVLGQVNAEPAVALLADADSDVRAAAIAVVGGMKQLSARAQLEVLVVKDADAGVRRNAAWALGKLGTRESHAVLVTASNDSSGLVRMTAKAALASLRQ